jgi:hypothetical protein
MGRRPLVNGLVEPLEHSDTARVTIDVGATRSRRARLSDRADWAGVTQGAPHVPRRSRANRGHPITA